MHTTYPLGSCGVGFVCNIKGIKSHEIVKWGVEAVKNLTHRGAVGADEKTGDGAGVLTQIPRTFFIKEIEKLGYTLLNRDALAVGVFFLYKSLESEIESVIKKYGLKTIGWRDVPVNDHALGESALSTKPPIKQLLIDTEEIQQEKRELQLYLARRSIEKKYSNNIYIPSLSSKTIIYKGLLVAPQLDRFYPDLTAESFESSFCIFHQRFSTNTSPDWTLAQPFRVLSHNGEINTIQGNRNWISSIEKDIQHGIFASNEEIIKPLLSPEESDSASLDRIIEVLILSGFSPEHAINMCVPPAWECCDFSTEGHRSNVEVFLNTNPFL